MSQENVEVLHAAYAAFNRGDFDAVMAVVRPDAELIRPGVELPLKGRDAIRAWMEPDAFAEQRVDVLGLRAIGDKVLVRQRVFGRGAGSGIELNAGAWLVWTFDVEGLIARAEVFLLDQEAEALEAAGLSEEGMSQENVELAKRFNEAGRRDVEAALFQFVAEDVVTVDFGERLDTPSVFHGREALVYYYAQIADVFEGLVREIDEWVDAGDWTIAVGRWVGQGQSSHVPVEGPRTTNAARWRNGKIVEYLLNLEGKEAALEAVESRE